MTPGLLLAAGGTGLAFALALRLPAESLQGGVLLGATAFATMFVGLLLLVSRGTALSQVVGYLVLENGIFLFGLSLLRHMPILVEMGILREAEKLSPQARGNVKLLTRYRYTGAFNETDYRTRLTESRKRGFHCMVLNEARAPLARYRWMYPGEPGPLYRLAQ